MNRLLAKSVGVVAIVVAAAACAHTEGGKGGASAPKLPPEPVVTFVESDAAPGQRIEHGELISSVDEARQSLHAQHHPHKALET